MKITEKVYQNEGNRQVAELVDERCVNILDIGCGGGDTGALISQLVGERKVTGVTFSSQEADIAKRKLFDCFVCDIEVETPESIQDTSFDCLIFSHVLEHVVNPSEVLARYLDLAGPQAQVIVAVPNVCNYRMRWRLFWGDFSYESSGLLDEGHLRFFSYYSIDRIFSGLPVQHVSKHVSGSVPLWLLRRVLPTNICRMLDETFCKWLPNLFGSQTLVVLTKS